MQYVVYKDSVNRWRWHLLAANNEILADSGQGYENKSDCLKAIAFVKSSSNAPIQQRK
jgi:uncharacterized protein YegP (UPF0339 family)